jgi:PAS domain S-box-containing protein
VAGTFSSRFARVPVLGAGVVAAHGAIVLVGWWAAWPVFVRPPQHFIPMAPSTALGFLLLGLALLTRVVWAERAGIRVASAVVSWTVAGVTFLNLAFPAWLDEILGGAAGDFGRVRLGVMSPVTAGALLLLSVAGGLVGRRTLYASACATVAALVGATVALGYAYGTPLLYGSSTIPVALPTGLSLLLLGSAVVAVAGSGVWPLQPLVGPSPRARMLRAFLPATAGLVVFIGLLDARFGASLGANRVLVAGWLAVAGVGLVTLLVSRLARRIGAELDHAYADRHRAEQRYAGIVDIAGDAIVSVDERQRIQLFNQGAERIFSYTAEEVVGQPLDILLPARVGDAHRQHVHGFAQSAETARRMGERREVFGRRKDGTEFPAEASVSKLRLGSETVFTVMLRDITDRRSLESQLLQAQKMEAVGQLAGGIAHDFNNLLTAIFGSSDLLLGDLSADDRRRADVEDIKKAAERAAALTRQLLAFSRQQVLAPQVLDLNALIADLEKMLQRLIGEDVEFRTVLAPELGAVRADPGQIEQVIMNLAVNARDAMPRGGKLTIETANVDLDEAYTQAHVPVVPGRYAMLAVSDTGVGMDAQVKAHLFEPFFTTKEKGKGTGLGLATVYGIVKQSDGHIWVYSEPGQGTTFKIYLPRVAAAAEPPAPKPMAPASLRGSETVLVVEDEEAVRKLTRRVLEAHGYAVLAAGDGQEALRLANEHDGPINLLVTDVVMPNMSGRQLAERVVSARRETRVLYLSGYTDDAIIRHGVLDPGIAFLQKPFTPQALARKLREVLDAG